MWKSKRMRKPPYELRWRVDKRRVGMFQSMKCVKRQNLTEDEGVGVGRICSGHIRRAGGGKGMLAQWYGDQPDGIMLADCWPSYREVSLLPRWLKVIRWVFKSRRGRQKRSQRQKDGMWCEKELAIHCWFWKWRRPIIKGRLCRLSL